MHVYLELSEDGGSGHKFYEVTVEDATLTVRYGRIGTNGQTQTKTFEASDDALREANKKLAEKRKKGYVDAVKGEREKRAAELPALRLPKVLAPYRDVLEATVKPYVSLRGKKGSRYPWTSKLGGLPYQPLGTPWPTAEDGHPLVFLAQLNFAELPTLPDFPERGIVQFFIRDDMYYGASFDVGLDMVALGKNEHYRVRYFEDVVEDEARLELTVPPHVPDEDGGSLPHDPMREFVLTGELASGPITTDDRLFEHLIGKSFFDLFGKDLDDTDEEDEEAIERVNERYMRLAGDGHKLGGYPTFTQFDPRRVEDAHVLLFQLDMDHDLGVMWGDGGHANFFIHPDDLARRDFSRVVYNWDCC